MITLAMDTSSSRGSVAVCRESHVLFSEQFASDRRHSSQLFEVLQRALDPARRIDRIVVGIGPGSYAGVRVAIAAAIGLSAGIGAEIIGIPSIVALDGEACDYGVLGDARRGSYFLARIRNREWIGEALLFPAGEAPERLLGAGTIFSTEPIPQVPQATLAHPSAEILARLASEDRSVCRRGLIEPIYLREPHITHPKDKPLRR